MRPRQAHPPRPGPAARSLARLGAWAALAALLGGVLAGGRVRAAAPEGGTSAGTGGGGGGPDIRVVSQTVGTDEMLLALAEPAQIAALSHLARNPDFSSCADQARAYPQLGTGDAESVLRYRPTLVLAADYSRPELIRQLRGAGLRVVSFTRYATLDDSLDNLRLLGRELGPEAQTRAAVIADRCRSRLAALSVRLRGTRPVRVIEPSTYGLVAGAGTTFQDLCDHAGAVNLASALAGLRGHQPPPEEQMLAWPVDRVVVAGADLQSALAPFRSIPPYSSMAAIRDNRAVLLPARLLGCVTFRRVDAYEALARALHPEAFRPAAPAPSALPAGASD